MTKTLAISEARNKLLEMPDELEGQSVVVAVSKHGRNVLAILPWEFYESLEETLEVLSDKELMGALKKSVAQIKRKKIIPWQKVKGELGL